MTHDWVPVSSDGNTGWYHSGTKEVRWGEELPPGINAGGMVGGNGSGGGYSGGTSPNAIVGGGVPISQGPGTLLPSNTGIDRQGDYGFEGYDEDEILVSGCETFVYAEL